MTLPSAPSSAATEAPAPAAVPPLPASPPLPAATPAAFSRVPYAGSFKLAQFWPAEPILWFKQAEATFRRLNVTDNHVKYDMVLEALPPDVIITVRDLVNDIKDTTPRPYNELKFRLLSSYSPSRWALVNRLLDTQPLGDGRPSILMDYMLSLLPEGEPPGDIFLSLFLRRLPQDMREHLAARPFDTPRQMAECADLLWDARGQPTMAASLTTRPVSPAGPPDFVDHRRNRRSSPRPRTLCWYHRRFEGRAHRCIPPCDWDR